MRSADAAHLRRASPARRAARASCVYVDFIYACDGCGAVRAWGNEPREETAYGRELADEALAHAVDNHGMRRERCPACRGASLDCSECGDEGEVWVFDNLEPCGPELPDRGPRASRWTSDRAGGPPSPRNPGQRGHRGPRPRKAAISRGCLGRARVPAPRRDRGHRPGTGRREGTVTVQEILARLERVSKTHSGWMARCPAHEDARPSLSVAAADDGRDPAAVLRRLRAGGDSSARCGSRSATSSPSLRRSGARRAAGGGAPLPAPQVPPWRPGSGRRARYRSRRSARIFGASTRTGNAVVFRYRDADGRLPLRQVSARSATARSSGGRRAGVRARSTAWPTCRRTIASRVVVVEGELDLHALRAVGIQAVVSVPDGAGSRLTAGAAPAARRLPAGADRHRRRRSRRGAGAPSPAGAGRAPLPARRVPRRRRALQGRERRPQGRLDARAIRRRPGPASPRRADAR